MSFVLLPIRAFDTLLAVAPVPTISLEEWFGDSESNPISHRPQCYEVGAWSSFASCYWAVSSEGRVLASLVSIIEWLFQPLLLPVHHIELFRRDRRHRCSEARIWPWLHHTYPIVKCSFLANVVRNFAVDVSTIRSEPC